MKAFYLLLILATFTACNQSGQKQSGEDKNTPTAIASVKLSNLMLKE